MTYQTFVNEVEKRLNEVMNPRNVFCKQSEREKNNGTKRVGIMFNEKSNLVCPVLYLEEAYQAYMESEQKEETFEMILLELCMTYEQSMKNAKKSSERLHEFCQIKDQIIYTLVNRERNKELLEKIPFVPFLDLAIVFKVIVNMNNDEDECATCTVTNEILKKWDCNVERLYEVATNNTKKLMGYTYAPLSSIINQLIPGTIEENESQNWLYIATNDKKMYGAGVILYPNTLKGIANFYNSDFYLLPSSIHEWIVLPTYGHNQEELTEMVRTINATQVMPDEVLSDRAYFYNQATETLE